MKKLVITVTDPSEIDLYKSNGADEVLVALKNQTFSFLQEFSLPALKEMIDQSHACGMSVSVLMNRLYKEEQIQEGEDLLAEVLQAGTDTVVFADPGLLIQASQLNAMNQMIYRPETLMTSVNDAKWWMEQGLAGVMISSLLTKDEIVQISSAAEHTGIVIHGRQLLSVSGRKLLTAYQDAYHHTEQLEGKKNLFLREDSREGMMPIYENQDTAMIFSDYIQESFHEMNAFMENGIERYVIDTSGLKQEEVIDALQAYRKILNGEDAETLGKAYCEKYASLPLSDGYYGQKTVK